MAELSELVEAQYFGNDLWQWTLALGLGVLALIVGLTVRRIIRASHARLAAATQAELMELPVKVASRTTLLFLIMLAIFAGAQILTLPAGARRVLITALTIAAFWQVGLWATAAVLAWLERKRSAQMQIDRAAVGTLGIIGFIARVLIWALVLLLTLDNLGIDITALIAGLGIGGIAVALAVQNVLGDLLASLSITLDRPFVIGDFLIVDEFLGTVEHIGVKSVRLRSLTGEQIVMSNADLLSSRVRNYGRMRERRVVFSVGVIYETAHEKLVRIAGMIRSAIEAQQDVRFDRCHFAKLGAASLDFEAVYFVLSPDYNKYMDIHQAINFAIVEAFESNGVEFAYPTQKLWLQHVPSQEQQEREGEGTSEHAQSSNRA